MRPQSELLNELRGKLAEGGMSVLVGAGFSKNASKLFPSWSELLMDLAKDLYSDELEQAFDLAKRKTPRLKKQKFINGKAGELLKKKGYLEVVSLFLKQSHTESIATYIERRTPYVEADGEQISLSLNGDTFSLKREDLALHELLIELPWNNIYTTNYDNLLDICVKGNTHAEISRDIEDLEASANSLREKISAQESRITEFDSRYQNPYLKTTDEKSPKTPSLPVATPEQLDERRILMEDKQEMERELEILVDKLEHSAERLSSSYSIVTDAVGLRLKRNSNIIKLHGSLRDISQRERFEFGFDGDPRKHYVISKEDYDSYPGKHEAFTQLMRISLLQESFCLVGFSGDDPNFLAWVGWVREILQREKGPKKDYKIYLVSASETSNGADRQLFFENNRIAPIELMDPATMDLLYEQTGIRYLKTDKKKALTAFMEFLSADPNILTGMAKGSPSLSKQLRELWKKTGSGIADLVKSPEKIRLVADEINLLPDLGGPTMVLGTMHYNSQQLLLGSLKVRDFSKHFEKLTKPMAWLIVRALSDSLAPVGYHAPQELIDKLKELDQAKPISALSELEQAIKIQPLKKTSSQKNKAIQLAFSFNFAQLRKHLDSWETYTGETSQKAGMLSIFDPQQAMKILEAAMHSRKDQNDAQRLAIVQQYHWLKLALSWKRDQKTKRLIDAYEAKGYRTMNKNSPYLLDLLEEKTEKIAPLGAGRFSVGRYDKENKNNKAKFAIQYLGLLVHSDFQLKVANSQRISPEEFYPVISNGFEYYPHGFLFYGLQLRDDSFIRRIGQDYAQSTCIDQQIKNTIAQNLLNGLEDAPYVYWENIAVFLSSFLNAVPARVWQKAFMEIWHRAVSDGSAFEERHLNRIAELAQFAFRYLEKPTDLITVLEENLKRIMEKPEDNVVDYVFHIQKNQLFASLGGHPAFNSVSGLLDQAIESLSDATMDNFFVLGNISVVLSEHQKNRIQRQLNKMKLTQVHQGQLWQVLPYFAGENKKLREKIKQAMLSSKQLWETGINGRSLSSGAQPLPLSQLSLRPGNSKGIHWTEAELSLIYEKMISILPELVQWAKKREFSIFSFEDIIQEMYWFICHFQPFLMKIKGYAESHHVIEELHRNHIGYIQINEGLSSDLQADVVWALSELTERYYDGQATRELMEIVLWRLLLKSGPAIEASLSYLSTWIVKAKNNKIGFFGLEAQAEQVLDTFRRSLPVDSDIAFVQEKLGVIALNLIGVQKDSKAVQYWTEAARISPFNNVRAIYRKYNDGEKSN